MTTGYRLKEFRKRVGFTQIKFAFELGISKSQYLRYEKDESLPSSDVLMKLHRKYDLTPDFVLLGYEKGGFTIPDFDGLLLNKLASLTVDIRQSIYDLVDKLYSTIHINEMVQQPAFAESRSPGTSVFGNHYNDIIEGTKGEGFEVSNAFD